MFCLILIIRLPKYIITKKWISPLALRKRIAELIENELGFCAENHIPINSVRAGGYVGVHEVLAVGRMRKAVHCA